MHRDTPVCLLIRFTYYNYGIGPIDRVEIFIKATVVYRGNRVNVTANGPQKSGGECCDVLGPPLQRRALLGLVRIPVIDPGDASLVTADMIENRFDYVGLDAKVAHARGY